MTGTMTWVGLDVHARSIHAAALDCRSGQLSRARFGGEAQPVVDWLLGLPQPVHACYEAGPTGYVLYRVATAAGLRVDVVAPTKTPRPRGDRVKSDRKDAELLVRQLLAGALTAVVVPDQRLEAARDLARCREQLRFDLARARQRASKLLLRHGRVYPRSNCTWSQAHWRWLHKQRFPEPATELAYLDYLAAIEALLARRAALDERLSRLATEPEWWSTVARLRCFRGVETLTALALHLELGGDWQRFRAPDKLASYLGLVPSLAQSGEGETRGSITKSGSGYARRLLVEAAWHYERVPAVGSTLARRQQGQPAHVLRIAWQAQRRLYRLYRSLRARGKPGNVATVAAARELACFLWAAAVAE
jgi:transposase